MKNYFFITGTGKGIGKALANILLENKENFVYGLSRTNEINHTNFSFTSIDLSNAVSLENYTFPVLKDALSITLINNAGVIGDIKPMGKKENTSITKTITINTIAPIILANTFIATYQKHQKEKLILNISSGAGRHAIHSWADYCASKSALDMFSLVIEEEQQHKENPIKIFSVAPGIIDTNMQNEIRATTENDFPLKTQFVNMKNTNTLSSPQETAQLLLKIINNKLDYQDIILDVRKI